MTEQVVIIPADKAPQPKSGKVDGRGRPHKWPLEDMKVGEAIEIPADKVQSLRQKCSNLNSQYKIEATQDTRGETEPKRWSVGEGVNGKFYVWRHK